MLNNLYLDNFTVYLFRIIINFNIKALKCTLNMFDYIRFNVQSIPLLCLTVSIYIYFQIVL